MSRVTLIVTMHTAAKYPKSEIYQAIFAGKSLSDEVLDEGSKIICDNTGENISEKNREFCELTSLYWAWKNLNKGEYVGLCHYRRYFDFGSKYRELREPEMGYFDSFTAADVEGAMSGYDVILPEVRISKRSLRRQYAVSHQGEDLDKIEAIVKRLHPEYMESYTRVMISNILSPFNMFICRKELFNGYCEWLFSILFELEREVDTSDRDSYQRRLYGFLSERLLNVYFQHNGLRVKYLPVTFIKSDGCGKYPKPQSAFTRWKYNLKYKLSKK